LVPHDLSSASSTWYDATLIDSPSLATLKHNITTILDRHYPPVEVANEWELDICIYWDMLPGFGGEGVGVEAGIGKSVLDENQGNAHILLKALVSRFGTRDFVGVGYRKL
jgi:hypothetical protein